MQIIDDLTENFVCAFAKPYTTATGISGKALQSCVLGSRSSGIANVDSINLRPGGKNSLLDILNDALLIVSSPSEKRMITGQTSGCRRWLSRWWQFQLHPVAVSPHRQGRPDRR